jgi:hypothetical protein
VKRYFGLGIATVLLLTAFSTTTVFAVANSHRAPSTSRSSNADSLTNQPNTLKVRPRYRASSPTAAIVDQIAVDAADWIGSFDDLSSAAWVSSTEGLAESSLNVQVSPNLQEQPVYVIEIEGNFTLNISGPSSQDSSSPGSCSIMVIVVSQSTLNQLSMHCETSSVDLSGLGTVETDSVAGLTPANVPQPS